MLFKNLITTVFGDKEERIRMWCIDKTSDPFGGVDLKKAQTLYDFVTKEKRMARKK